MALIASLNLYMSFFVSNYFLVELGDQLRRARKKRFPYDDMPAFALRVGVSRATLQRMEKGDLSVSFGRYYRAAEVLGLEQPFLQLFQLPVSLFDD